MELTFTGTGTLHPTERAQTSVLLKDDPLLFDCGSGVLQNIVASDVDAESIDDVVLSHRHPDHVCGLVALVLGTADLTIHGPPHTGKLIDRVFEPYPDLERSRSLEVNEIDPGDTVSIGGRTVDTMETIHNAPSMAFRVDDAFVYSGDTAPMAAMSEFADGCELLVHECHSIDPDGGGNWHSNPAELAATLEDCAVERLYLVHIGAHARESDTAVANAVRRHFDREIVVPDDLDDVVIPE